MPVDATAIALRRFGLGPRPGDVKRIAGDPRGFVVAQLASKTAGRLDRADLSSTPQIFAAVQEAQFQANLLRALQKNETTTKAVPPPTAAGGIPAPSAMSEGGATLPMSGTQPPPATPATLPPLKMGPGRPRDFYIDDATARFETMVKTETAVVERLVSFWSNHFAVSALKGGGVRGAVGAFEREAIRPHVLGRFGDMLKAVEQHPVMLIYLDNQLSIGPGSPAGRNRGRGLNENLAREILELHTLGVNGGYTQADVTNLARVITGWAVAGQGGLGGLGGGQGAQDHVQPGTFAFTPNRHEPGLSTVLGKSYGGKGRVSGEEALADLARHPSTARHIGFKLASHFVSATPPQALVDALAKTFLDTDGDLAAVARVLVSHEDVWTTPLKKVAPPCDFAVSLVRGLELKTKPPELMRLANLLGQPLWQVQSPKGWTDDDNAWMGPAAVRERLRAAEKFAREIDKLHDPREVASDLFGAALSEPSRLAIDRAESREQAFELMIMTPEFQRR